MHFLEANFSAFVTLNMTRYSVHSNVSDKKN